MRDERRTEHCAVLGNAFAALARSIDAPEPAAAALESAQAGASTQVMTRLRQLLVREETRKITILKAVAEAEDCVRYYSWVRLAWHEAGRFYLGMGELAPQLTEADLCCPAAAAVEAYEKWHLRADLGKQAEETDTSMERLRFELLQTVPCITSGSLQVCPHLTSQKTPPVGASPLRGTWMRQFVFATNIWQLTALLSSRLSSRLLQNVDEHALTRRSSWRSARLLF